MSESIIKLNHIVKNYGSKAVLKDVSLDIHKGDIYGLVGKNGAGKSTMFKVLLGLSDYQGGTIELEGNEMDLNKARHRIGFLIGNNFFGYMTAKQNLKYFARMKGIKHPNQEVKRVLALVGLEGVNTKAARFSLGMKQRLGIANALLGNPDILILDEPTNGLDPQGIMDIRNLVKKLNQELGMTIIISSHILGELQNTANRFGILNNGSVVKELAEEDLQATDNVIRLSVKDKEKAKALLERSGIPVLEEKMESQSLEEYYFSVVGQAA